MSLFVSLLVFSFEERNQLWKTNLVRFYYLPKAKPRILVRFYFCLYAFNMVENYLENPICSKARPQR